MSAAHKECFGSTPEHMTFNKVLWTIFAFRSIEILLTNIFLRVF